MAPNDHHVNVQSQQENSAAIYDAQSFAAVVGG
jgi:hypothetical protein